MCVYSCVIPFLFGGSCRWSWKCPWTWWVQTTVAVKESKSPWMWTARVMTKPTPTRRTSFFFLFFKFKPHLFIDFSLIEALLLIWLFIFFLISRKIMDKQTFSSIQATTNTSRYAAAVFRKGLTWSTGFSSLCVCTVVHCGTMFVFVWPVSVNTQSPHIYYESTIRAGSMMWSLY